MNGLEAQKRLLAELAAFVPSSSRAETARPFIETGAGGASLKLLNKLGEDLHKKGDRSATVVLEGEKIRLWWGIRPNSDMSPGFEYRGIGLFSLPNGLVDIEYTVRTGWVNAERYMRYGMGYWLKNLIVSQANGWAINSATEFVRGYMGLAKHHSYVKRT